MQDTRRRWSPLLAAMAALAAGLAIGFLMGSTVAAGNPRPETVVTRTVAPPSLPPYQEAEPVPVVSGNG